MTKCMKLWSNSAIDLCTLAYDERAPVHYDGPCLGDVPGDACLDCAGDGPGDGPGDACLDCAGEECPERIQEEGGAECCPCPGPSAALGAYPMIRD